MLRANAGTAAQRLSPAEPAVRVSGFHPVSQSRGACSWHACARVCVHAQHSRRWYLMALCSHMEVSGSTKRFRKQKRAEQQDNTLDALFLLHFTTSQRVQEHRSQGQQGQPNSTPRWWRFHQSAACAARHASSRRTLWRAWSSRENADVTSSRRVWKSL